MVRLVILSSLRFGIDPAPACCAGNAKTVIKPHTSDIRTGCIQAHVRRECKGRARERKRRKDCYEQLREGDFESIVAPQLLAEEHRRKNGSAALGVGLEVSDPLSVGCGKTQQPQNQCGQRSDDQQGFGTLGALCSGVAQRESEAAVLEVANGLLDLHTLRVDALDSGAGPAMMRQRGGEQPRGLGQLSILRATSSGFARPARPTTIGAHQVQPAPVPMTARQTSPADVAHARRGLSVQRIDEAPAPRVRFQVFDTVAGTPYPVYWPKQRLDL